MFRLSDKIDCLRGCFLFETLPVEALNSIALIAREMICLKGDTLFKKGDEGFDAWVVLDGEAQAFRTLPDGQEIVLSTFRKCDIFGEFALLSHIPRTAGVRVTKDLSALRIEKEIFLEIVREYPEVAIRILGVLVRKFVRTENKLLEAMSSGGTK